MREWLAENLPFLSVDQILEVAKALFLVIVGFVAAQLAGRTAWKLTVDRLATQQARLFRRVAFWVVLGLFAVAALHQLGFNLGVLLGAAGVLSVAIGFASQTSASNLISGLFLIAEKPFGIGDVVQVGTTTGEVLAIDLLSVKLRTFDNLFVRIPNETLIKSEIRTWTKFPIRRVDLKIGVAYREDLEKVHDVLFDLADKNPLCLDEPKPLFFLLGFGDSSIEMQFSPWATTENWIELKNTILLEIKKRFDAEGIEIPFPQRTLHAGSEDRPIPVRVVEPREKGD